MARRTLSSSINYWNLFKQRYRMVFAAALGELARVVPVSADENAISECLLIILRNVCFHLNRSRQNEEVRMPIWEAPIQPVTGNDLKGKKSKRPDFTCYYFNAHANSPEQQEIPFHVECKRLGCPGAKSPSWKFNDNYVSKGIKRFDCASFNYGKGAPSGMMIGYIISMSPEAIVCDVNGYQKEHLSHFPDIEFNFDVKAVFQGLQEIERLHVSPVQFELIHLWVDLRKNSN